ncbi:MAG: helix-turn-helix domain-containing protein [Actinobacteria bacterium]|nr:helix-turn-helix domain-containing protein [Actinomycetota bacterium]
MARQYRLGEEGTTWGAARVLDVLEFLGRRTSPAPASIIASSCKIPRSSTYGLLNLLKERRFVSYRADERAWSLGSAAFELSADAPLFAHGLAVLRAFATVSRGLTVQQIASGAGMSRAAVTRILPYLVESDLLRAESDGTYSLGLELVSLASRVGWVDRLRIAARIHLVRLRDATAETANLILLDGDHAIYVDQVESSYALRHSGWVGRRVPLAGTATGAAFGDRVTSHVAKDAVEAGVTSIVCAIDVPDHDAAVGITAPSWRIEEFGIPRAQQMVEAVSREIAQRLRG